MCDSAKIAQSIGRLHQGDFKWRPFSFRLFRPRSTSADGFENVSFRLRPRNIHSALLQRNFKARPLLSLLFQYARLAHGAESLTSRIGKTPPLSPAPSPC